MDLRLAQWLFTLDELEPLYRQGSNYWKSRAGDRLILTPNCTETPKASRGFGKMWCDNYGLNRVSPPQPTRESGGATNLVHFSFIIWHQVSTILIIFWESTYQISYSINSRPIKAMWSTGVCGAVLKTPLATGLFVLVCVIDVGLHYFCSTSIVGCHFHTCWWAECGYVDYCIFVCLFVSL